MSRRNNSSRRRTYGRRQHEVRERRPDQPLDVNWPGQQTDYEWPLGDAEDDRTQGGTGDPYGGLRR